MMHYKVKVYNENILVSSAEIELENKISDYDLALILVRIALGKFKNQERFDNFSKISFEGKNYFSISNKNFKSLYKEAEKICSYNSRKLEKNFSICKYLDLL